MVIGAYVRRAAPDHLAGAEWALHDLLAALADRGHDCRVFAEQGHTRGVIDGVTILSQPTEEHVRVHFASCEVMLTQLEAIQQAQILASSYRTPLVHLVHSSTQLERLGVLPGCAALVVHNTQSVADAGSWWPGESIIVRPVVRASRYLVEPNGQLATLVNLSHQKGAMRLVALAEAMPGRYFLGVQGAYGGQAIAPDGIPGHGDNPLPASLPANLGVSGPVRDMRPIYQCTRVLLVLSTTETYGRVAEEAMLSGIPVVAYPTSGLFECCGSAAAYVEPGALRELAAIVERAYSPPAWLEWSDASRSRARDNHDRSLAEVTELETRLERIARVSPEMTMSLEPHRV